MVGDGESRGASAHIKARDPSGVLGVAEVSDLEITGGYAAVFAGYYQANGQELTRKSLRARQQNTAFARQQIRCAFRSQPPTRPPRG